ncbi:exported hypothetical protein [Pseudomonas lundensis]|uniref:Uncharacterized protein n=1 Tax=Pseudomonas lundensis TaxID=86185 RepID=A0AAX2H9M9_9PSED|nr:exported hypothetical protein [Pseudomonas lundensis]
MSWAALGKRRVNTGLAGVGAMFSVDTVAFMVLASWAGGGCSRALSPSGVFDSGPGWL